MKCFYSILVLLAFCILSCGRADGIGDTPYSELKEQMLADPLVMEYNMKHRAMVEAIVNNRWNLKKVDRNKLRQLTKGAGSMKELQKAYAEAGVDSSFLVMTTDMLRAEAKIRLKYKAYIAKYPKIIKEVKAESQKKFSIDMKRYRNAPR